MAQAAPSLRPLRRARLGPTTLEVAYDLAMTRDESTAAARIASRDLAISQLLSLAAEFDAAGSPTMAQHARRVAREMTAEKSVLKAARDLEDDPYRRYAVGMPPVTPITSPVM